MYSKKTVNRIKNANKVAIYCAGVIAEQVFFCLSSSPYNIAIDCFLVTSTNGKHNEFCGRPVISVDKATERISEDDLIIIACMERLLPEIYEVLKDYPFKNILPLTFESDIWADLRANYFCKRFANTGHGFLMLDDFKSECGKTASENNCKRISVFSAQSSVDKAICDESLKGDNNLQAIPIFAGAALADCEIDILRDDIGVNISDRNKRFCEVTALYWAWRNDDSDYIGLCHYRRKFVIDKEAEQFILNGNADVILTIPVINIPDVKTQFIHDHDEADWDIMSEAVRILQPDYYDDLINLENGNYYYGYNMLIAKKEIFSDYCNFLFPILVYCDDRIQKNGGTGRTRHIGFLSERLLGVYMLHHWDEYRIFHARRHFIQ